MDQIFLRHRAYHYSQWPVECTRGTKAQITFVLLCLFVATCSCGLLRLHQHVAAAEWQQREVGANTTPDQPVVIEDRDRVGVVRAWR